LEAEHFEDAEK